MQTAAKDASDDRKKEANVSPLKAKLNAIGETIEKAADFDQALKATEAVICQLLGADHLRLYRQEIFNPELVTTIQTADGAKEIRHLLSPASIAGFTALSQHALVVVDVHDDQALAAVNPQLKYNTAYDLASGRKAGALLSVPILHDAVILGVFQAVNPPGKGAFSKQQAALAHALTVFMGKKIHLELNTTSGPFELLVQQGLLSEAQLEKLEDRARREKTHTASLLTTELGIAPDSIGVSLEKYYQVPFMAVEETLAPPDDLTKGISSYYLKSRLWVPVSGGPDGVVVLMKDPSDRELIAEIQRLLGAHSYEFKVGLPEDILAVIGRTQKGKQPRPKKAAPQVSPPQEPDPERPAPAELLVDSGFEGFGGENATHVIRRVNKMVADAYQMGASDIHVEPSKPSTPSVIRMRVDGVCREVTTIPDTEVRQVISRIKIISGLDISERRKPQDGKAQIQVGENEIELRVATLPTVHGESAVLRLLASAGALPFEQLNLSPRNASETLRLIEHPHGIFLVVGPTGSGKTTTLHAILGKINTPDRKIWTAEDPVEITQRGLQQVQVLHKIGLDFAAIMRSFLRADPDVILIGEMRDFETANIGIESSLTGHLVFSTLHTNSATETVIRLLDMGLDPFNFSDALLGVLAQRLVRTLCPDCKVEAQPSADELAKLTHAYGEAYIDELDLPPGAATVFRPAGCDACHQTGYRGRTGVHELMTATEAIKRGILKKWTVEKLRERAREDGMRTLIQDGIAKIFKGDTDLKQLHRVAAE
jgi:type II secretory ATPase GspE/PulE/Tfp pilus assembly ATPase PilB-like protein